MCTNRLEKAMPSLEKVEVIVSMSSMQAIDHPNAHDWENFMSMGSEIPDDAVMERISRIKPSDTAALIYTSGQPEIRRELF